MYDKFMTSSKFLHAFVYEGEIAFLQVDGDGYLQVAYDGALSEACPVHDTSLESAAQQLLIEMPEWQSKRDRGTKSDSRQAAQ